MPDTFTVLGIAKMIWDAILFAVPFFLIKKALKA